MRRTALKSGLLAAALVGLVACGGKEAGGPGGGAGGPPGGMQLPVETVTLAAQPLDAALQTVGSLRADESVVVRPEVAGRIDRIAFTEGARVSAGQVLFSLDDSIARAALNEAAANLENSRRSAARAGELSKQKLIAQSDYDTARAALGVDQARVESARAALAKMTLRAPFSGQVGLRNVSVGEFVSVGQDLVTLVRLDPIEVDFAVPEGALAQVRTGQKLQLTVDAYPGEQFGGDVVAIDPVVDPNSRSAKLRARIANPDGRLKPGQFAQLRLDTGGNRADAILVPEQALMQQGDTRYVFTVVDGKAKRTEIKTGVRTPGFVQVVEGLKAGDVVITAGQAKPMMADGVPVASLPPDGAGAKPGAAPAAAGDGTARKPAAAADGAKEQPASGG